MLGQSVVTFGAHRGARSKTFVPTAKKSEFDQEVQVSPKKFQGSSGFSRFLKSSSRIFKIRNDLQELVKILQETSKNKEY